MRKTDVEISYHTGTARMPMVNVKLGRWGLSGEEWTSLASEFPGFREWWDALEESSESYTEQLLEGALEFARERAWEDAQGTADDVFGAGMKVWSAGRSGGWCVVDGLPAIETWDAIALGRWARFAKYVRMIADDVTYQTYWGIAANVYDQSDLAPVAVDSVPSFT